MYSRTYKGRCDKKRISKCKEVIRCYDKIMLAYLEVIEQDDNIVEVHCNVPLENFPLGDFTSNFVCVLKNGDIRVRECIYRDKIEHPIVVKKLDASRIYWLKRGVKDWGILTNAEE